LRLWNSRNSEAGEDEPAEVISWKFEEHRPYFRLLPEELWWAFLEFRMNQKTGQQSRAEQYLYRPADPVNHTPVK
jgi:hypothetical protein